MLTLKNVSLTFNKQSILSNINLEIPPGEIVILLGSNGSGKSSLLKLIDRRYALQEGNLSVDHQPIKYFSSKKLSRIIMTLTQNPLDSLFTKLTVKENYLLAIQRAQSKNFNMIEHLTLFNTKLIKHSNTLVENLSGGEQQALVLALACLAKPKILLLDEHTSSLDPHTAKNLMQLTQTIVKMYGMTCIMTTHQLDHALHYGDRIIALQQGKIIRNYSCTEKSQLSLDRIRRECYLNEG